MEEAGRGCGLLKVVVTHGRNLAVRDFTSSDPYVIVHVADKTTKTKVINSCLNPVWNEEMTFSMKEPVGIIKFAGGVRLGPVQVRRQDGPGFPGPAACGGGNQAAEGAAAHSWRDQPAESEPGRRQLSALR
ncbi:Protein C2-DOMAIN ABA-RELATED 11 [Zea mays]|uniref:Protein C2-DOMAIN ABA-RELATED 11 n=1 Tax=Zea mays TaxID=4577 RepID=A0A1D6I0I7_MAIZE|nr:Protein C2-DOMAIN ABA-RELATED 11 [Zea mays]